VPTAKKVRKTLVAISPLAGKPAQKVEPNLAHNASTNNLIRRFRGLKNPAQ
jgi:hypothetical protein